MIEMLLLGWLAISIFLTFVFCTAARWFVSEPDDTTEELHRNRTAPARKQESTDERYSRSSPYVM